MAGSWMFGSGKMSIAGRDFDVDMDELICRRTPLELLGAEIAGVEVNHVAWFDSRLEGFSGFVR
jgi:hypothetical protein